MIHLPGAAISRRRERLLEDLGFQRLLAEQSLQLAHLALQGPVIRCRHDLFAAAGGRQRPLHHQPAPREELVRGNAMSASHDLMLAAVEHRFGPVNRLPVAIEWLSDNGSCYLADKTRSFARDIGFEPRTTPLESPQSNGMAEAFVRTIKRDYVRVSPRPDAETVMRQLPAWIAHYKRASQHPSVYVIEENRLCWSGCDPAGCLGFWRARSVMAHAGAVERTARLKIQGPSGKGWSASIPPASAATLSVLGAT